MGQLNDRRREMGGKLAELPSNYIELEYAESIQESETWVDSEYIPNWETSVEVKFMAYGGRSNVSNLVCTRASYTDQGRILIVASQNKVRVGQMGSLSFGGDWSINGDGKTHIVEYSILNKIASIDNTLRDLLNTSLVLDNCPSIWFFRANGYPNETYGWGRIYYVKIYENESLVRHYIPCENPKGEVGFYEVVKGKFHGTENDNKLIAGPYKS